MESLHQIHQSCSLYVWSSHFQNLSSTQIETLQILFTPTYLHYGPDDVILDIFITAEELEDVLSSLKRRKSLGPDNICDEHLVYGGPVLKAWLLQVLNAILSLESVPASLKTSTIIPIYKGGSPKPQSREEFSQC